MTYTIFKVHDLLQYVTGERVENSVVCFIAPWVREMTLTGYIFIGLTHYRKVELVYILSDELIRMREI